MLNSNELRFNRVYELVAITILGTETQSITSIYGLLFAISETENSREVCFCVCTFMTINDCRPNSPQVSVFTELSYIFPFKSEPYCGHPN